MKNDSGSISLAKTFNPDSFETTPSLRDIGLRRLCTPLRKEICVIITRVDNREMISPPNSATRVAGASAGAKNLE